MADRIGQQLGNYRITRLLGSGGFAEVYLGEHIYLKSQAALKVLRTSLSEKDVQRFLAEAQTLVRLRHPHIVRVLEFAVEQGTPVLVMDYAPGGIIRETYPRGSSLQLKVVLAYVKQIASALQYAHNHNVIHRDVKPENILLGPEQELLLSDFGLSLLTASPDLLSTQEMAGTIPYMAPEQLHGKPVFASDQYALGIVTYEWLCGTRPFTGTIWEIAQQHLSVAPPSLCEKCPELPAEVEDVVLKALAKEPQQRFVSVQAFAHALARASKVSMLQGGAQASIIVSERSEAAFATQPDQSFRRVFLAVSPADQDFATRLKADLEARGMLVESSPGTADQEEKVRQAIRAAQFVLVVASSHMRSSRTIKEYLRIASMYERQLVFVWAEGDDIVALLPEGWGRAAVIDLVDAREDRYEVALDELVASLEAAEELSITSALAPYPSEEGKLPEARNPYKGLRAFTQNDATDFFGRDALIQELVDTIQDMFPPTQSAQIGTTGARLLTVIGPSGSGKSSMVMAGLLPQLQNGALPGSDEWVYLDPIVPGQHPMEALTLTLSSHFPARSLTTIREDLQDDATRGLHLLAASLMQKPVTKVMLMVDQFEELFTQTTTEEERRRFIDLLLTGVTELRGPLIVILTLRADFYDRLAQYPELGRLIQKHHQMVFPMETQDLRAIIEQPAALPDVQLTFEGNLVGDLLFEAQGQVGALPLLEFTLDQLFQQRKDHKLTLEAYQKIGGVKGALAKHAEATYASLPSEDHRRLARALFLRLIDPGLTEQDTARRRAAFPELSLPDAKQTTILKEAVDAFIAARLLTTNEVARTTTVEVSHEALIREWKRLADWLTEAREDIHLQQAISEDVAEWERRGKPKDRLYRGSQLKEANVWVTHNIPSKNEVAFLRASAAQRIRSVVSMLAILLLLISSISSAGWFLTHQPPDPIRVTNLQDNDLPGSLRYAIDEAPPKSTITFNANLRGTILLTTGNLIIAKDLTLRGSGEGILSISSGKSGHIIRVIQGITVTIFGLTFKDSNNSTSVTGFIDNQGTLTLSNSSGGGGISNEGTLLLDNSTVSDNTAIAGGGILSEGSLPTTTTIINSTISDNQASSDGGGILIQSFFYPSQEYAIARAQLTFSTIYGNTAHSGGDIAIEDEAFSSNNGTSKPSKQVSQVKVRNSIIAGDPPHPDDIVGMLTSYGYNLFQDTSGATFDPVTRMQHGTDKILSANDLLKLFADPVDLLDNGGPTRTYALAPGSPAIDQIPLDACLIDGITTDQRGVKRPQGSKCDIGAYEYQPA